MTKAFLCAIAVAVTPKLASAVSGKATGSLSMALSSPPEIMSITHDIFAKSGKGHKSGKTFGGAKAIKPIVDHHSDDDDEDMSMTSMSMMHVGDDAKAGKTMFDKSSTGAAGKTTKTAVHAPVDAKAEKVSSAKAGKMAKTVIHRTDPFAI